MPKKQIHKYQPKANGKNHVGVPGFFSTPAELDRAIQKYFDLCERKKQLPLVAGLAYTLGFESRQSLHDYKVIPEFAYSIKRALLFISSVKENWLTAGMGSTAGLIFSLCNDGTGYLNPQRIELTGKDGKDLKVETVIIGGQK